MALTEPLLEAEAALRPVARKLAVSIHTGLLYRRATKIYDGIFGAQTPSLRFSFEFHPRRRVVHKGLMVPAPASVCFICPACAPSITKETQGVWRFISPRLKVTFIDTSNEFGRIIFGCRRHEQKDRNFDDACAKLTEAWRSRFLRDYRDADLRSFDAPRFFERMCQEDAPLYPIALSFNSRFGDFRNKLTACRKIMTELVSDLKEKNGIEVDLYRGPATDLPPDLFFSEGDFI